MSVFIYPEHIGAAAWVEKKKSSGPYYVRPIGLKYVVLSSPICPSVSQTQWHLSLEPYLHLRLWKPSWRHEDDGSALPSDAAVVALLFLEMCRRWSTSPWRRNGGSVMTQRQRLCGAGFLGLAAANHPSGPPPVVVTMASASLAKFGGNGSTRSGVAPDTGIINLEANAKGQCPHTSSPSSHILYSSNLAAGSSLHGSGCLDFSMVNSGNERSWISKSMLWILEILVMWCVYSMIFLSV